MRGQRLSYLSRAVGVRGGQLTRDELGHVGLSPLSQIPLTAAAAPHWKPESHVHLAQVGSQFGATEHDGTEGESSST